MQYCKCYLVELMIYYMLTLMIAISEINIICSENSFEKEIGSGKMVQAL